MGPACIINNLKIPVSFAQKGRSHSTVGPNELAYFTWSNIIEERLMELTCGDWKGDDKLETNRFLDLKPDSSKNRCVYFVSFLLGSQRTILFTDDLDIGMCAFGFWETDKVDMQAEISLQEFGLSVVDNFAGREILYIGISSSDILWEEEVKKNRFKPLAVKYMEQLEEKYQNHLVTPNSEFQTLDPYQVNMATMIMKKKKSKEVKLRRIFEQGIWMNYGKSAQRTRMHFKINHLQIDNQLNVCVFPLVLAVVPPPKSIIADNAPKPFIELSLLQRQSEYSSVPEIEYGRALIQEFSIQVDQGLINALLALVANQVNQKPYGKEMFDADLAMSCVRLEDTAQAYKTQRPKSFYNDLHISPLMIHLSFSQGGVSGDSAGMMPIQSEFVNLFIKSVGVSLTELQDVVFKLAYFERRCMFYSPDQLNAEIVNHYTKQFLKQLYVLVLGLDIIGNPFGLVRDLSTGVEDLFYQPFQGAIQGPEELVQGLTLGVSSLFGHTIGGAAGAVGRITGTVGKGVAALTFDESYQKKRQEEINRRPQSFTEGMARGMKGLGMGVVDGLTGVVTKPMEGARQDGAKGLFKGVDKGLIGVVTRPVSGVVDFASSTMGAVRTVAGSHRDAEALRPPRVIKADRVVRPYSAAEALGFKIFKETDRGSLFETDEFITFAPITDKIILLVTKKQLILSKRNDVMGVWTIDWQTEYLKMQEPQVIPGGIKILLKEEKRGFLGFGASDGKIFTFENAELIQQKILLAYKELHLVGQNSSEIRSKSLSIKSRPSARKKPQSKMLVMFFLICCISVVECAKTNTEHTFEIPQLVPQVPFTGFPLPHRFRYLPKTDEELIIENRWTGVVMAHIFCVLLLAASYVFAMVAQFICEDVFPRLGYFANFRRRHRNLNYERIWLFIGYTLYIIGIATGIQFRLFQLPEESNINYAFDVSFINVLSCYLPIAINFMISCFQNERKQLLNFKGQSFSTLAFLSFQLAITGHDLEFRTEKTLSILRLLHILFYVCLVFILLKCLFVMFRELSMLLHTFFISSIKCA